MTTSPRLLIRSWHREELEAFIELARDPRVTARVGDGSRWSRERARTRFERAMRHKESGQGLWLRAGSLDRDRGDALIGLFVAELLDHPPIMEEEHAACHPLRSAGTNATERIVEVGFWIAPDSWGHGYASELLRTALPLVTTSLQPQLLIAEANVDHAASARVLAAAGFVAAERQVGHNGTLVQRFDLDPREISLRVGG